MKTAILVYLPTSSTCLSVRLVDAQAPASRPLWSNRCYPYGTKEHTASIAAAKIRMVAWARSHGITVRDALGMVIVEPAVERAA